MNRKINDTSSQNIVLTRRYTLLTIPFLSGLIGFTSGFFLKPCDIPDRINNLNLKILWGTASRLPGIELVEAFEKTTRIKIDAMFAGAGPLLSALELNKSGDIYLGVGTLEEVKTAFDKRLVLPSSLRKIAYLVPVIIVQKGNPKNITSLDDLTRSDINLCLPDVRYGIGLFLKKFFENNSLWSRIESKFVQAKDGEDAVAKVILKSVDATVSWHVFYYWNSDKVDVVWIDPQRIHEVSVIPAVITSFARDKTLCEIFINFLTNTELSRTVFAKYKYVTSVMEGVYYTPYTEYKWVEWIKNADEKIEALRRMQL